jgi:hypothetical protein
MAALVHGQFHGELLSHGTAEASYEHVPQGEQACRRTICIDGVGVKGLGDVFGQGPLALWISDDNALGSSVQSSPRSDVSMISCLVSQIPPRRPAAHGPIGIHGDVDDAHLFQELNDLCDTFWSLFDPRATREKSHAVRTARPGQAGGLLKDSSSGVFVGENGGRSIGIPKFGEGVLAVVEEELRNRLIVFTYLGAKATIRA